IRVGVTELVLDGISLGPLGEGAAEGRLEISALRLFVRGSMVPATHRMMMRTADATGSRESEIIIVDINADRNLVPVVSLDDTAALVGDRVLVFGHGDRALLLVHEPTPGGPRLHLVPRGKDEGGARTWASDEVRTVAVPGLVAGSGPRSLGLPVAALRHERPADDQPRVRVAWRVDQPGTRIDLLDAPWETVDEQAVASASLTVEQARAERPAEHAELGRPWLLPDRLLAELYAPRDVEAPRPGDRSVVYARIHGDGETIDAPQLVAVGTGLVDLDRLGAAADPIAARAGRPAPFTLRADQRLPLVLDLDAAAGVLTARPSSVPGPDLEPLQTDVPLVTVTGAFGSRAVAGLRAESGGRMQVASFDDLGGSVEVQTVSEEALPDLAQVSGEIAPGSVAGLTVFLVPFGPELPVHVVVMVGDEPEVVPLPELRCDSVALAPDSEPDALPLACARDGEVWLGTLATLSMAERRGP
ncbi:MAG: hypothetical protein AB1Z98_35875, partial [Nannocystaceae bacterium]